PRGSGLDYTPPPRRVPASAEANRRPRRPRAARGHFGAAVGGILRCFWAAQRRSPGRDRGFVTVPRDRVRARLLLLVLQNDKHVLLAVLAGEFGGALRLGRQRQANLQFPFLGGVDALEGLALVLALVGNEVDFGRLLRRVQLEGVGFVAVRCLARQLLAGEDE